MLHPARNTHRLISTGYNDFHSQPASPRDMKCNMGIKALILWVLQGIHGLRFGAG
jgi:hypothetical protein